MTVTVLLQLLMVLLQSVQIFIVSGPGLRSLPLGRRSALCVRNEYRTLIYTYTVLPTYMSMIYEISRYTTCGNVGSNYLISPMRKITYLTH